jgi:hypothetical protein
MSHYVRPPRVGALPDSLGTPEHKSVVEQLLKQVDPALLPPLHDPTEPRR